MKKTVKILSIICAALMILSLCACGAATGTGNGGTDNSGSNDEKAETMWAKDAKTLENAGYTTHLYTSRATLSGYELGLKTGEGSLVAYITATKTGGATVTAYYFASATVAAEKHAKSSGGTLKGEIALIYGDTEKLISE